MPQSTTVGHAPFFVSQVSHIETPHFETFEMFGMAFYFGFLRVWHSVCYRFFRCGQPFNQYNGRRILTLIRSIRRFFGCLARGLLGWNIVSSGTWFYSVILSHSRTALCLKHTTLTFYLVVDTRCGKGILVVSNR